jgi:hypothetical protein
MQARMRDSGVHVSAEQGDAIQRQIEERRRLVAERRAKREAKAQAKAEWKPTPRQPDGTPVAETNGKEG